MILLQLIAVGLGVFILILLEKLMSDLSKLQADVFAQTAAVDSAVTLIEGLAQQIRDNANDPAALEALATSIEQNSSKLAAAVAANTPATGAGAGGPEVIPEADLEPIVDEGANG